MVLRSMHHRRLLTIACLLALFVGAVPLASVDAEVGLVYFRATPTGNGNILVEWQTATELDMVGFRLSRSLSATGGFTEIQTEPAQGNASTGANYSYVDTHVAPGTRYYYLLESISSSGTVLSLAQTSAGNTFRYLPMISAQQV